jgi:histidinol-phosphate aminotransferase
MTPFQNTSSARILHLLRPNIATLKPYASARDEFKGEASVFLDANENSLGNPLGQAYHRYPDPRQRSLTEAIANMRQLPENQIFIGNGSDEAIDLLLRAFVQPGTEHILILPPTYGMYTVQATIHGCGIQTVPLNPDFTPETPAVLKALEKGPKIVFLCSPNNPSGQSLPEAFVLEVLKKAPGLVVLDEAYADFSEKGSFLNRITDYPNLVVLQTLSKAWGLAALRIGMAFGHPTLIEMLQSIKYPYNIGLPSMELALAALEKKEIYEQHKSLILSERTRLQQVLPTIPCILEVFPSDANFLLLRTTDANRLWAYLVQEGIIVRNRHTELHCQNCLRVTIGQAPENDQLIQHLKAFTV